MLMACAGAGCCNRGKSKSEVFAILDKHRLEYGKCEVIAASSTPVDGQQPWLAATVCRAKHRKVVLDEVGESKNFEAWFDDWKKENGAKATEEARSSGVATASSGDDCPGGANCLNRCRAECEGKHGKIIDTNVMGACARAKGSPADCVNKATNKTAQACFMKCRGL